MPSDLTVGNWRAGASRQVLQVLSQVERTSARGRGPQTEMENAILGFANLLDGHDNYIQEQDAEKDEPEIDPNQLKAYDALANQSGPKKVEGGKEVDAPTEEIDQDNKPLPVGFGQIEQVQEANATDGASSPVVSVSSSSGSGNDVQRRRELQEEAQPQPNPLQVEASVNDGVRDAAAEQYQEVHDYATEDSSDVDQQEAQEVAQANTDRAVTGKPGSASAKSDDSDQGETGADVSGNVEPKRKRK